LEGEEIVSVANKNANKLVDSAAPKDHIEGDENPGQIYSLANAIYEIGYGWVGYLKLETEPEGNNPVLVELAPDIEHTQHHWLQQEIDVRNETNYLHSLYCVIIKMDDN
jgi:hypothetical protein